MEQWRKSRIYNDGREAWEYTYRTGNTRSYIYRNNIVWFKTKEGGVACITYYYHSQYELNTEYVKRSFIRSMRDILIGKYLALFTRLKGFGGKKAYQFEIHFTCEHRPDIKEVVRWFDRLKGFDIDSLSS